MYVCIYIYIHTSVSEAPISGVQPPAQPRGLLFQRWRTPENPMLVFYIDIDIWNKQYTHKRACDILLPNVCSNVENKRMPLAAQGWYHTILYYTILYYTILWYYMIWYNIV